MRNDPKTMLRCPEPYPSAYRRSVAFAAEHGLEFEGKTSFLPFTSGRPDAAAVAERLFPGLTGGSWIGVFDHAFVFTRYGRPAVFFSEPYDLYDEDIAKLEEFCGETGARFALGGGWIWNRKALSVEVYWPDVFDRHAPTGPRILPDGGLLMGGHRLR